MLVQFLQNINTKRHLLFLLFFLHSLQVKVIQHGFASQSTYLTEQHRQPLRNSSHSSYSSPDWPMDIDCSTALPKQVGGGGSNMYMHLGITHPSQIYITFSSVFAQHFENTSMVLLCPFHVFPYVGPTLSSLFHKCQNLSFSLNFTHLITMHSSGEKKNWTYSSIFFSSAP